MTLAEGCLASNLGTQTAHESTSPHTSLVVKSLGDGEE